MLVETWTRRIDGDDRPFLCCCPPAPSIERETKRRTGDDVTVNGMPGMPQHYDSDLILQWTNPLTLLRIHNLRVVEA
ncbi:unnamed protein product [Urochloa humidicola]